MRDGASPNSRNSGRRSRIQFDLCSDAVPERALGQRDGQPAVAQIVRRFRQTFAGDQLANRLLHPLFVVHVERRGQSPQIVDDVLGVLGAAEAYGIALAQSAEQDDRAARLPEGDRRSARRFSADPTMPITGVGKIASPSVSL